MLAWLKATIKYYYYIEIYVLYFDFLRDEERIATYVHTEITLHIFVKLFGRVKKRMMMLMVVKEKKALFVLNADKTMNHSKVFI